jgi:hypothetical protein
MTTFVLFARRQNHDLSIDSICTKCYQTIASEDIAIELTAHEESHLCDPNSKADRDQMVFSNQNHM